MRYPPAEWKGDGVSGGTFTGAPYRVVIHTTETRGIPGYADGRSAPHLTYSPTTRKWYQHTDLRYACRALRNETGGVQTNRANAIQVEIVCYSSRPIAERLTPKGLWVGDLPDTAYEDLRSFLTWCYATFNVVPVWPGRQALSSSQSLEAGFRMSATEWDTFNGVCGHQHVPENTHWDPGAIDWGRLITTEQEDDMTPEQKAAVDWLVAQLAKPSTESWAATSVSALKDAGIYSESYKPGVPVTEERLAVFLKRALDRMNTGGPLTESDLEAIIERAVAAVGKKLVG